MEYDNEMHILFQNAFWDHIDIEDSSCIDHIRLERNHQVYTTLFEDCYVLSVAPILFMVYNKINDNIIMSAKGE